MRQEYSRRLRTSVVKVCDLTLHPLCFLTISLLFCRMYCQEKQPFHLLLMFPLRKTFLTSKFPCFGLLHDATEATKRSQQCTFYWSDLLTAAFGLFPGESSLPFQCSSLVRYPSHFLLEALFKEFNACGGSAFICSVGMGQKSVTLEVALLHGRLAVAFVRLVACFGSA